MGLGMHTDDHFFIETDKCCNDKNDYKNLSTEGYVNNLSPYL